MSTPDVIWRRLSPLVAARRSMRLWNPVTEEFADKGQTWTKRLPAVPAAVPIYRGDRTCLLALDFDAKHHTAEQVDADVERVLVWLHECGARTVTDRSTSGGRHVLVPLATNSSLRIDDVRVLMELLAARLKTLDRSPMLGVEQGCITPPGSPCREGGYRRLEGSIDDAIDAFTVRSDRGVVARLIALLGGASTPRHRTPVAAVAASLTQDERLVGVGRERRLDPRFVRSTPFPEAVETYAATGKINKALWPTPSEARQSVISHAVLRGASAADIEKAIATKEWAGVRRSYIKKYRDPAVALRRDVEKALTWAAGTAHQFHQLTHKNKLTGGGTSFLKDRIRRKWLAHAQLWIDSEFLGTRQRPVLLAVVQALAYTSALAGELVEGVPVVAIGGRSLSHSAGLMSESTVWSALRVLRETPGSPLLLVARGAGREADRYALTTPATTRGPGRARIERARVESVHPAWSVLGLRGRMVYELVAAGLATNVDDVFAGAMLRPSNGYAIVAVLTAAGLIERDGATLGPGSRTLDDVADAHGLETVAADRVVRHRAERLLWQVWLENRFYGAAVALAMKDPAADVPIYGAPPPRGAESEALWAAMLAAGPPKPDPVLEAMELLSDQLGAVIVCSDS
ncbi:hypothetical protein HQO84_24805 [Rhodococcus fascians]|uniref:hypothetical protein n=1 Tax=Rhodococcoides fascians TaxID=1828 RepID=UPI0006521594|nr:hypothetical protein [Rhodococcus fascians]KMJ47399.1 hypothetical protein ACG96_23010 [Rhodococcus fascians]MBX5333318.1 hypothetical protein [Rhodococcus fascians]MBY3989325.1 hypothetical protein [Rhodococcus fascians]MBY3999068.1 hypothetical protein [Rhodococcus fascians]MBY4004872.1 hypothetical protein [Rhodococcus fascians]